MVLLHWAASESVRKRGVLGQKRMSLVKFYPLQPAQTCGATKLKGEHVTTFRVHTNLSGQVTQCEAISLEPEDEIVFEDKDGLRLKLERCFASGRRLVRVLVSSEMLIALLTQGNTIDGAFTVGGVPEGAVLITYVFDPERALTYFIFYHPSFDEVPLGEVIPVKRVTIEKTYDPRPE